MKRHLVKILLPVVILTVGVVAAASFRFVAPVVERQEAPARVENVEVIEVSRAPTTAMVRANGVVTPARQVQLAPQVNGRVVWQAPALLPGGRFSAGQVIARIDARDYRLAIEQERSRVQQRQVELQLERSRQEIAAREWQILGDQKDRSDGSLALRKPQLAAAQSNLEAAESGLRQAKIVLARTTIRAPFNGMITEESVEVGQVVAPGTPLATLIGTDSFWVKVSVPLEKLDVIDVPGINAESGSRVRVHQRLSTGKILSRAGEVLKLQGELDPQTRTAQLLVSVDQPLASSVGQLPLLPGAYVDVEIEGRPLEDTISIPRAALTQGNLVWVVDQEDRLQRRKVAIGWRERDEVVVTGGLEPGERLVTSPIATPVEGMAVAPLIAQHALGAKLPGQIETKAGSR